MMIPFFSIICSSIAFTQYNLAIVNAQNAQREEHFWRTCICARCVTAIVNVPMQVLGCALQTSQLLFCNKQNRKQ
jgi:hypothetical protein